MPPQIKQDLNRSGWETTDFPSVCENCLPDNPYVQMLKDDHGAECKIVRFQAVSFTKNKLMLDPRLVHAALHSVSVESGPNGSNEEDQYMLNLCSFEELLPVLHA